MIFLLEALLLAISSNLDDLGVGFSLGIRANRIQKSMIIIIALISGLTMTLGMTIGTVVLRFVSHEILNYLPSVIFVSIAVWFIWEGIHNDSADSDNNDGFERKSLWKTVWLGLALGVDSFILGITGGIADYPLVFTAVMAFATSYGFIWLGTRVGNRLKGWLTDYSDFAAGGILLVLAILE